MHGHAEKIPQMYNFLIIGQGLAGTLLTHFLLENNQTVHVIDAPEQTAASQVAAGIINPITGRRYVKSWKIDELIPQAETTYSALERQLGISIFHRQNIIRSIFNHREEQDWYARTLEPTYQKYIVTQPNPADFAGHTDTVYRYGELTHAGRVDIRLLVTTYRMWLSERAQFTPTVFEYDKLVVETDHVQYGDIRAQRLVFCEGHRAIHNPLFNYLPFGGAKGEVLIVRIPDANFGKIFKHRVFIVPMGDDLYWIGATYDWSFENDAPTDAGKTFLADRLNDILKVPFEIVDHRAAIRPTVKDRRPFLGKHPDFSRLAIFNGLGTKGASLGPYFAQQMTNHLLQQTALEPDVDITRFASM